jgi:hypothetical protein
MAGLIAERQPLTLTLPDGQYHIDAAAVCLPGFWRLEEKFRMSLDTLHFEANVPHYGAKLQKPMNRFFKNLSPEKPVIRNNVRRLHVDFKSTHLLMFAVLHATGRRPPLVPPDGQPDQRPSGV